MNSHKHAKLMMQYAQNAMEGDKPWNGWQCRVPRSVDPRWEDCGGNPVWSVDCEYRRKPKQHTFTLNTEQLKEILMACDYPDWQNENFVSGVQVLQDALGVQPEPKTNEQIACDLLGKAYDELEEHSALICEPNVDHIQKLVWDAMKLLSKENNND